MLDGQHPQNLCAANVEGCEKEADMNIHNNQQTSNGSQQVIDNTFNPVGGVGSVAPNGSRINTKDAITIVGSATANGKVNILYSRLSRDDELQGPSNSIINQQQQLQEYAERNGLVPYIHIEDDGYSGTRWDRPGWQELIAKVEADEVACICIKDGSRLGRDYLRVGLYRELFRDKGIRLIAINDCVIIGLSK